MKTEATLVIAAALLMGGASGRASVPTPAAGRDAVRVPPEESRSLSARYDYTTCGPAAAETVWEILSRR
jgi:hypothetical protein